MNTTDKINKELESIRVLLQFFHGEPVRIQQINEHLDNIEELSKE